MTPTSHLRRASKAQRPGFTLTELLVVVLIVALLVGTVAPSLGMARARSKNAVCHSRLREIGVASGLYREGSPNGYGIPVHPKQFCQCYPCNTPCPAPIFVGAYEWGGKSGIGDQGVIPGTLSGNILGSKYGSMAGFGPATRPMNKILYPGGFRNAWRRGGQFDRILGTLDTTLDLPAYRCPADDGPPGGAHCPDWVDHPERSSYDQFGNSYAANTFMVYAAGGQLGPEFLPNEMGSNSPYLRPVSRVPAPARTMAYEENIGRWAWACKNEIPDCGPRSPLGIEGVDPGPTKAVRGWHGKNWTFNHLYVDGHTDVATVWIEGTEDAEGFANHYRNECDPNDYLCQRCIRVRGDGWQKDTLPADFVRTQLIYSGSGRPSYERCAGGAQGSSRGTGASRASSMSAGM